MNKVSHTIPKNPALKPAEDYYRLRREGIGLIEQMGSRLWTDYNTHDPGITILEVLCYTITDLAYRTGWDIKDILTPSQPSDDPTQPFPNQPFFTAREILTINPWTPDDFRRLLIDLERVRNAWVFCKECACDAYYYAWCEEGQLRLAYQKPANLNLQPKKIEPLGLYEILLELESDPELGDLNDRKIEYTDNIFAADDTLHPMVLEMRFPEWQLADREQWELFLDKAEDKNSASFSIQVGFGATEAFDVLTDLTSDAERDEYVRAHWRHIFYVRFEIALQPGNETIIIPPAALRIFGDTAAQITGITNRLKSLFEDKTPAGFIQRYRNKLLKVQQAIADAKTSLHSHRNLDEDYCRVQLVKVEDIAVCADVEVAPDADIERIQAQIWFEIERYFNPPVPFYTLQALMDADVPVEDIFNGPELSNGFIKAEDLQAAGLKTILRISDIINRLMDIEGVISVNNLLLTGYDDEGKVIKGTVDPTWNNATPLFDPNKISASWLLYVAALHQPRLYLNQSRFLFYKNGLPFRARKDEAHDTLKQLRGEAERPKIKNAAQDLPIPAGTYRNLDDYFPVQNSFPLTYGIGTEGLPSHATTLRRVQAKQLKAYLMIFEQLLGNALAQVTHSANLFSLDPTIRRTYFVREFTKEIIQGYDEITTGLNQAKLEAMTETLPEFHERRNRFLDHMMARFGEQFGEYTLLLTNLQDQQVAFDRLIDDKISFLKAYPEISHDRGQAFNYKENLCAPDNICGLKKRISLLLGHADLTFYWTVTESATGQYAVTFQLKDRNETNWFEGNFTVTSDSSETAELQALREIIAQMVQADAYEVIDESGAFRLKLNDKNGDPVGQHPTLLQTKAEALALRDELLSWSSNERAIVVEHLLLRPKFPGDALYPACTDGACETCGGEDPYSFRLTFVMPGWTAPYNVNMDRRNFADRTIRLETPAHLLAKICWVGNDGFIENPCDPIITELVELLMSRGRNTDGENPLETDACACADAIYGVFSKVFEVWYEDKTLDYIQPDMLQTALEIEFSEINPAEISCTTILDDALWVEIQTMMVKYFHHVAFYGWQFERFEQAWCKWLGANAVFDWTEERLQERVEAILMRNLIASPVANTSPQNALCQCAASILTKYGVAFYHWMDANFKAGSAYEDFTPFNPDSVTLCTGFTFKTNTATTIEILLKDRYDAYKEVSYRLWVVIHLLSELRNTYPGATLHDCDDGSDLNPVRLGLTALGNYPLRQTLSP